MKTGNIKFRRHEGILDRRKRGGESITILQDSFAEITAFREKC